MDEKGLQVFLLVALHIYGQLFQALKPKVCSQLAGRKSEQPH